MNKDIIQKLTDLKNLFINEGFIIEGVFGSYSRAEETEISDIDILFELNQDFKGKYKGFKAISRLDSIKEMISLTLKLDADLVQKSTLRKNAADYILKDIIYV